MKPYPIGQTLTDNILHYDIGGFNEMELKNSTMENVGIEVCSNIMKVKTQDSDRGLHPTQKPLSLMETLIKLVTKEGQVVLDPFCGCGTTLLATKNLNRDYIGFEIDKKHYENVLKRIEILKRHNA